MRTYCLRSSGLGVQLLDLFYTASSAPDSSSTEGFIPDSHRLRSMVCWYISGDTLASFLSPASRLERLEIRGHESFLLFALFSDAAPRLRELVISRCILTPNNQFGSLTALNLLCQWCIDAHIYTLPSALRFSPHLEELRYRP